MRINRIAGIWVERGLSIGLAVFGAWIAVTSAALIWVGLQSGGGWLSIAYGGLGVSMGLAGVIGAFLKGVRRSALLGWFLAGIAWRAVVDGTVYLWFVSIPFALGLLALFVADLVHQHLAARKTIAALLVAGAAIASLPLLALAAPAFPPICSQWLTPDYPVEAAPFDTAESRYVEICFSRLAQ